MRRSIGFYPKEWEEGIIQKQVKQLACNRCEDCQLLCNDNDNWSANDNSDNSKTLFGCHHIDHNRANNSLSNIVFLCQRCHLKAHRESWIPNEVLPLRWVNKIPNWIINRNIPYKPNPQKKLWSE